MFDIAAFTRGWPSASIPTLGTGLPPIPPSLGPDGRSDRRSVRDVAVGDGFLHPDEKRRYKGYVAGTAEPADYWFLHRMNGWVSVDKDIDAGGLAMVHAELELVAEGLSLDMPTRLFSYRYATDDNYDSASYAADVRRHAAQSGNTALRLFIDLQQRYEVRLRPVIARMEEQEHRIQMQAQHEQDK